MLRFFLSRYITRFERQWSYDASYMRELLDLSPWAFIKFGLVTSLGRHAAAPPAAIAAAGLVGTLTEDCGLDTTLSQNAMRFHGRIALDREYNGLALDAGEGERIAHAMNGSDIVFLGNHGVVVCGERIDYAYMAEAVPLFHRVLGMPPSHYGRGRL